MTDVTRDTATQAAEIRLEQVSKAFGGQLAVRGVSLHIARGEFYTLLGPSGCGKTTLLRMIAGFVRPDEGRVFINGECVNEVPPWRREVGLVFQNFALWPHMSVFENVAFGLRERRRPRPEIARRVHAALELVHLTGLADRRPSQLSGGQQQRVALARTLVVQPRGLLLDEPLSNLDARLRAQMRDELVRLQEDLGITTVYVTHDQEEALALSTHVAILSQGCVIQEGVPRQIYEAPCSRAVADFVGAANFLPATVLTTQTDSVTLSSPDAGPITMAWRPSFPAPPAPGEPVWIHLRPESLSVSEGVVRPGSVRIAGRIRTATYLGASMQYGVVTSAGTGLKVTLSNPRRAPVLGEGADVHVTFSPHDAVLLSRASRPGAADAAGLA